MTCAVAKLQVSNMQNLSAWELREGCLSGRREVSAYSRSAHGGGDTVWPLFSFALAYIGKISAPFYGSCPLKVE
jgi:hypothetical protein